LLNGFESTNGNASKSIVNGMRRAGAERAAINAPMQTPPEFEFKWP
jgi:DNA polymerase I-like protein with 3'-5' exonuclease and polymerase domains